MAKLSHEELLSAFEEMTLLELSEFVKLFEEKFDVTAAAPAAVVAAAPAGGGGGEAAVEEEKDEFDVILFSAMAGGCPLRGGRLRCFLGCGTGSVSGSACVAGGRGEHDSGPESPLPRLCDLNHYRVDG